jgi:hypothetical protein
LTEAFVDTTVVVDALLKSGAIARSARAALKRYDRTLLPFYALKEFKAGALSTYIWAHNKLAVHGSIPLVLKAIQSRGRQPYAVQTALEALQVAWPTSSLGSLVEKHGPIASFDQVSAASCRLHLATKIRRAWSQRRKLTSEVVDPLACYVDAELTENGGLLEGSPSCKGPCCLPARLRERLGDLERLRAALGRAGSTRREDQRRSDVLKTIIQRPAAPVNTSACRAFGDAYFALFAPPSAVILTTNVRDHTILAGALGKSVESV